MRANNLRREALASSGDAGLWPPGKYLITALIQDTQGVRLLRHVQCLEEGLGSHLGILQIGGVMFNPAQGRVSFVCFPDPKNSIIYIAKAPSC
jgi:hypothetical protein